MQLIDFFDRSAASYPTRTFLIDDQGSTTYAQSQATSHRIANVLISFGCVPGTKVAVFGPNLGCVFECILGLTRAGCAWVPLNAKNGQEENCHLLRSFDVELLLYHSSLQDKVDAYQQHVTCRVLRMDGDGPDDLKALMEGVAAECSVALSDDWDSLSGVFPTGGTTGLSKGAVWTQRTWHAQITNFLTAFPVKKPPVNLVVAPMTHAAGVVAMLLTSVAATFVILPGFSAERVPAEIEKHRVTHVFLPPTAIYMLLADPEIRSYDYSSLDYFLYAAAPMSVDKLREAMEVFGPVMAQTFGQAEAPMLCTAMTPEEHSDALAHAPHRLASCGRATLLTRVAVMDDDGQLVGPGVRGEIVVRGPLVMTGYYKNAEASAEASRHGWHHTSDIGYCDEDGYYYIVDRKRDLIISGGFNIYPSEIEQVLWSHPDVQDCVVIGVPDDKWGEKVKAFVEVKAGRTLSVESLAAYCRERLGPIKAPKEFELRDSLPKSPVGKVLKRLLRDEAWQGTGENDLIQQAHPSPPLESPHIEPLADLDAAVSTESLQALVDFLGYRPNALSTMAKKPGLLPAILELLRVACRSPGRLDEGLRFLVATEVSRVAGCGYSAAHTAHAAMHLGIDLAKLVELDHHANNPRYSAREQAALSLAAVAAQPTAEGAAIKRVAAFAAVRAWFDEEELIELVTVISAFGWFNRWNSLVCSELEHEPSSVRDQLPWLPPLLEARHDK